MPLAAGQTLAHYTIVDSLGVGGMGEVYRARDGRLGREVAIKVLPEGFVEDAERLKRFEREAKVLASLSHPNIDAIHGLEKEGPITFLVLELVPGETLSDRLRGGPLPLPEAADVCRQIASGLEAAHEAGVVHRDLKPANVRITPDGVVKVLDFGLAKPHRDASTGGLSTASAQPDSFLLTAEGVVLGTPTYMSPEQARGRPVDRRTDIWAFGCVLFECLTSRRAFPGSDILDILAAVREEEPDWEQLPRGTPQGVEELLRRCLVKEPRERLRDIGEARLALTGKRGSAAAIEVAGDEQRQSGLPAWALLVGVSAVSMLVMWFAMQRGAPPAASVDSSARPVTRFAVDFPLEMRRIYDQINDVAMAPDGRSVAISVTAKKDGIYWRRFDELEARFLPGTDNASKLVFSPDGETILFNQSAVEQVWRVDVGGGAPMQIGGKASSDLAVDQEGLLVFSPRWGAGLSTFSAAGEAEPLVDLDLAAGERHHLAPVFLPGGRKLLFVVWTGEAWDEAWIMAFDRDSGVKTKLPIRGTSPSYVPLGDGSAGALLWARSGALWAQRFDPERTELHGRARQVLDGVEVRDGSGQAVYDISPDGILAYAAGIQSTPETQLVWVDRQGNPEPACNELGPFARPSLSADATRATLVETGPLYGILTIDLSVPLEARMPRRLTFDVDAFQAVISPDGKRVAYTANPEGDYGFFAQSIEGAPARRLLVDDERFPRCWSSDGRWIAYSSSDGELDLYALDLESEDDGKPVERRITSGRTNETDPHISPDNEWVAFAAGEDADSLNVFVDAFPDGGQRLQVTRGGAFSPRWSTDGKELFYYTESSRGSTLYAVEVTSTSPFSVGPPEKLFEGHFAAHESYSLDYCPAPDGRFLMLKPIIPEQDFLRVVVVQDFALELEEKLGTLERTER